MPLHKRRNGKKPTVRKAKKTAKTASKRAPRARRQRMPNPGKLIISQPGAQTQSSFSHGTGKLQLRGGLDAIGVPSYYVYNKHYEMQPVAGTQGALVVGTWNSVPDMNNMSNEVQVTVSHPTLVDLPVRFCVRSLYAETMFTNSSNVSCVMDIYDIQCRRDIPLKAVTGALLDVSDPISAWVQGELNQATTPIPAGFTNGAYFPGSLPQDSQLFKDFYNIVSKKSIALAAGASHQHTVRLRHPRLLDANESSVEESYLLGVKGVTFFTMIVARGQVASSTGPGIANPSQHSTVLIRAISTERYEYQWIAVNGSLKTYSSTLVPPGTAGVALSDASFAPAAVVSA